MVRCVDSLRARRKAPICRVTLARIGAASPSLACLAADRHGRRKCHTIVGNNRGPALFGALSVSILPPRTSRRIAKSPARVGRRWRTASALRSEPNHCETDSQCIRDYLRYASQVEQFLRYVPQTYWLDPVSGEQAGKICNSKGGSATRQPATAAGFEARFVVQYPTSLQTLRSISNGQHDFQ